MGIAQKDRGAERHREANVSRMALGGALAAHTAKIAGTEWHGRHSLEQTNLQERGGPNRRCRFRRCMSPARHEGEALVVGEIEAKSSCDWANSVGLAGNVLFWDCPTQP